MKLNYLLTGLSFILVQYATSAFPMSNEDAVSQHTQLYKREHGAHLVKRKKHHGKGNAFDGDHRGKHRKSDPLYQETGYNDQNGYANPRYFKIRPKTGYGPLNGNPYPATDPYHNNPYPMSVPEPINSVSPASNPPMGPNAMNGGAPAGVMPSSASVAVVAPMNGATSAGVMPNSPPAAVPAAVPNNNPGSTATVATTANNALP